MWVTLDAMLHREKQIRQQPQRRPRIQLRIQQRLRRRQQSLRSPLTWNSTSLLRRQRLPRLLRRCVGNITARPVWVSFNRLLYGLRALHAMQLSAMYDSGGVSAEKVLLLGRQLI